MMDCSSTTKKCENELAMLVASINSHKRNNMKNDLMKCIDNNMQLDYGIMEINYTHGNSGFAGYKNKIIFNPSTVFGDIIDDYSSCKYNLKMQYGYNPDNQCKIHFSHGETGAIWSFYFSNKT